MNRRAARSETPAAAEVVLGRFRDVPPWLIRSHLAPPVVADKSLERTRLIERVRNSASSGEVWLFQAPAGFGKTTCLVQVFHDFRRRDRQPRWLSLPRDANRPERLLAYLWHAWIGDVPAGIASMPLEDRLAALIQRLESRPDAVLFLDDLDVLRSSEAIDVVQSIVMTLGAATILLGGRGGGLSLSKLEAAGRLRRIGMAELRFEQTELEALRSALPQGSLPDLEEATAGWPVAVATLLNDRHEADRRIGSVPRALSAYVEEQILRPLASTDVALLMDLSVLGWADHELLQSPATGAHSWDAIRRTLEAGLIVPAGSGTSLGYECIPALRGILRERLQRMDPERVVRLHRFAAQSFARRNLASQALEHAAACLDANYVLQTLESLEPVRLGMESGTSILRFGEHLRRAQAHDYPLVAVSQAYRAVEEGRFAEARSLLEAIKEQCERSSQSEATEQLHLWSNALECALSLYDDRAVPMEQVYLLEHEIRCGREASPALVASVAGALANICVHLGRYEDALAIGDLGMRAAGQMQSQPYSFYLHTALCMASSALGRMREAVPHAEAALAMASERHFPFGKAAFTGCVLRARLCLEANELDDARALIERAFSQGVPENLWLDAYAVAFDVAAAVAASIRGIDAVDEVIRRGIEVARRMRLPRLRDFIEIVALRESTRCGSYRAAMALMNQEIIQRLRTQSQATLDAWQLQLRILTTFEVARLQLATGHAREADEALAQVAEAAAADEDACRRFTFHALSMSAAFQLRRYARSFEHLERAVDIGLTCGLLRLLIGHRDQLLTVFDWSLRNGRKPVDKVAAFINSTLRFANAKDSASALRQQQVQRRNSLASFALSPRETEILGLLAEGYSTKEIARRLGISEGTAKTHRKNVYSKLGASTRAGVIAAARARALL